MNTYSIENESVGFTCGEYEAENTRDAVEQYLADKGYKSKVIDGETLEVYNPAAKGLYKVTPEGGRTYLIVAKMG